MDYKSDNRNLLKDSKCIDFETLITSIIHLYGEENSFIDAHVLENILINMLSEDGYNIACFINNTPEANNKLNWHYDISDGEWYITLK